jgi:dihydrodipicolinate synthase/N-acetylneuraminate lyase
MGNTSHALKRFADGCVIPAHPLALDADRRLDERRQRALSRYYLDAGAGGLAVAVHTTQFAIHEPDRGLLRPVLELAAETAREHEARGGQAPVLVAGVTGPTADAVAETQLAADLGYDLVLLGSYGAAQASEDGLIERARAVGEVLPVVGFYLQPAVGGRVLSRQFWRRLAELDSVVGVKVAPFDRYKTLDTVLGIQASGRVGDVALYTGNDDHIVLDLVTRYRAGSSGELDVSFVGGLLGQWSVWVRGAVETLTEAARARAGDDAALRRLLAIEPELTDANAALFDAPNNFHGCIPGVHEALRRQGLLTGRWCLDPAEDLSPGQMEEIDRIWAAYPHLRDDDFVAANLDRWLS